MIIVYEENTKIVITRYYSMFQVEFVNNFTIFVGHNCKTDDVENDKTDKRCYQEPTDLLRRSASSPLALQSPD